jgi:transcriptional regulator with XRE-family HTH domain
MRHRQNWSQPKLAEEIGTAQNQIYRLENPATAKPTISTLKRIAAVFDVALVVRFVPFSQLTSWASGTPFVDMGLSSKSLSVPSFDDEENSAIFQAAHFSNRPSVIAAEYRGQVSNVSASIITFRSDGIAMASPMKAAIEELPQIQAVGGQI